MMQTANIIYIFFGIVTGLFFLYYSVTSFIEQKPRAGIISLVMFVITGGIWFGVDYLFDMTVLQYVLPPAIIIIFVILFFVPMGKSRDIKVSPSNDRVDERDTMFAREDYLSGTEMHHAYYAMRPENKDIDEKMRKLPRLCAPGAKYYDPVRSAYIKAIFHEIRMMTTNVDGSINAEKTHCPSDEMTRQIKTLTRHLGAIEVGIAPLNQRYVYSHVGRGPEIWGSEIHLPHKYVICFTVEMGYENVEQAPKLPITEETAKGYLDASVISNNLAHFIRDLGFPARAHISGSNYQLMLPATAYDAGLGELGRHGYLIVPKLGSRIRLGAVTTDLPLDIDRPINFGVQDFCDRCKRCATNCPSASIPMGEPEEVRGVEKWPIEVESCMIYWRGIGTDCGLCMKVCPFSHPSSLVHDLVRAGIRRSSFARRISVIGEDLFYGKRAPY